MTMGNIYSTHRKKSLSQLDKLQHKYFTIFWLPVEVGISQSTEVGIQAQKATERPSSSEPLLATSKPLQATSENERSYIRLAQHDS